ncbi:MAG: type 1 fimbrial protein [Yokenella regensburgei]|jgi:major type 1 subunit fimbrin (pilin)|uniref:Major type 1 subunit fimbrin (Pilin) n=1 Tax=Yokenella regensburgei TaxID=158877 RepID=A0AB38G1C2_9ENTR|nr:fimbrial protein [Yokenella regensburgei]EHM49131.1 fimbrial protein [Yokenella regensburgei ATCC 43003]KAF1370212.1 major type 1 subunit fimbrin (pilin) [Yokenella regensburgei]KFD23244.1 SfmA family fimbriae-like adhesin [Yokenella regensburgei ATCC 49455]MDQ4430464.1 fimbrial protein [Yokenella regensburgei]MDR2216784.1 type 1 fimbrial protein [Yokenella regensburgei]
MKKILLPAAALILSATAMNAYAVNGKVEFTGEIIKSTCNVVSGDQDKQVFIGKYPTSAFTKVGDVTASKAFTIQLEKCTAGDYTLRFDGQTVAGHSNLLSVDKAQGVGIEILDNNEKIIPINQSAGTDTPWVTITPSAPEASDGTATFNLKARYKSFDTVQAGSANANANFTIEYK